jgi:phage terminase large subunit-like protein
VRASIQIVQFEAARVLFPISAPWLSELKAELGAVTNPWKASRE